MPLDVDIQKLAKEVAAVATVGFGRPHRNHVNTDQLQEICRWLVDDRRATRFQLFEQAVRPSVERLGDGVIGRLAQIEFMLAPEAKNLYYLKQRQAEATKQIGAKGEALKRLEKEMCEAIARDLVLRLEDELYGFDLIPDYSRDGYSVESLESFRERLRERPGGTD